MTSDIMDLYLNVRQFLRYNVQYFGAFFGPPTYPKIRRHLWIFPKIPSVSFGFNIFFILKGTKNINGDCLYIHKLPLGNRASV